MWQKLQSTIYLYSHYQYISISADIKINKCTEFIISIEIIEKIY